MWLLYALVMAPSFGWVPSASSASSRAGFGFARPTTIAAYQTSVAIHAGFSSDDAGLADVEAALSLADSRADADAVFAVVDVNGDGSITKQELKAHLTGAGYTDEAVDRIFEQLDANASGDISREELRAGFALFSPLRQAPALGFHDPKFVGEAHRDADAVFRRIDVNGDSRISVTELMADLTRDAKYSDLAVLKIFDVIDTDRDCRISQEEMRTAFVRYSALRHALGQRGFRRTFRTIERQQGRKVRQGKEIEAELLSLLNIHHPTPP